MSTVAMRTAVAFGVLAAAAACTSSPDTKSSEASTPKTTTEGGCTVTVANYGPTPAQYDELGGDLVWVEGPAGIAVLWYARTATVTTIGTNGTMGSDRNTKTLWIADDEPGELTLTATNLATGEAEVLQTHEAGTNFPTVPVLPTEGCWELSVTGADGEIASVQVRAEDMA